MARRRTYAVEWANAARDDLQAIVDYLADDDVHVALQVMDRIETTAGTLTTVPLRGRIVPELAAFGIRTYRELILKPWRIIYRVAEETVYVLGVLDGRRNMEDLLLDRLVR